MLQGERSAILSTSIKLLFSIKTLVLYISSGRLRQVLLYCKARLFAFCVILHTFCRLLSFFKINFFLKVLSGIPSECQTVWIQIRPNKTSGLIWFQTDYKSYQQPTLVLVGKELILWHPLLVTQYNMKK